MNTKLAAVGMLTVLCLGCSTYSLVETNIRSKLPADILNYQKGIITHPTETDIQSAIEIGISSKDDDRLKYAYLHKETLSSFEHSTIYVQVKTPLFLISNSARNSARDYVSLNNDFNTFCSKLDLAAIEVNRQYPTKSMQNIAYKQSFILLYNGLKVEQVKTIPTFEGRNPFITDSDPVTHALNAAYANIPKARISKEQISSIKASYKAAGATETEINTYLNYVKNLYSVDGKATTSQPSVIGTSNIYTVENLNKSGKYEIVFRTPARSSVFDSGDEEVRFPISFKHYK